MELHEFEIGQDGSGAVGDGQAVGGGAGGVGGFAVESSGAAGGQDGLPCPDALVAVLGVEGEGAEALVVFGEQVDDETVFEALEVRDFLDLL